MLKRDEQFKIALQLKHYFETLMYVELIQSRSKRRTPVLEFGDDENSYQTTVKKEVKNESPHSTKRKWTLFSLIHIGIAFFTAEDKDDLFWQIHYILGHEIQHAKSTTEKDWQAAHNLCFRDACEKLAKDVLGKTKVRLISDADYDNFFKDLASKGVFINQGVLMNAIHYILNTLEDGRIENIRCRKHPGFKKYRKLFRGKHWLENDIRDNGFPTDVTALTAEQTVEIYFQDMYYLATCSVHQKGFLAAYGDTVMYRRMKDKIIPKISAAVLSRSCKGCMEHGRNIFNEFLDEIIETCKLEADMEALMQMLQDMLDAMSAAIESTYNEDLNNEEEGDGLPSESVFGSSDLECEMDEEEFEEMKKKMEEEGDDIEDSDMAIVISKKGDSETEEGDEGESAGESIEADMDGEESSDSDGDGNDSQSSDAQSATAQKSASGKAEDGEPSDSESAGQMSGSAESGTDESSGTAQGEGTDKVEDASNSSNDGEMPKNDGDSAGVNNKDEAHSGEKLDKEELEKQIREAMEEAAKAIERDIQASEADRQKAEDVAQAAEGLAPVKPADVDLSGLNLYYGDVEFHEELRIFEPSQILPFELENKGRYLNNRVEEMIKNKKTPDNRGMRVGKFDSTRAHVLVRGELTCYKTRGTFEKPDVAGYILIDNSGSMGNGQGSTRYYACDAAAVIEEGFKNHMPLKIAAFDAYGSRNVTHEVIKEFDENVLPNLSYNFKLLGRSGYGNKDGFSIRVATQQLMSRNEKDKILIVMSDGFPSDYDGGYREGCQDVRDAVLEARKAGIKVIGMYMYHDQCEEDFAMYRKMYEPYCIFAGMDDIQRELERVFKQLF